MVWQTRITRNDGRLSALVITDPDRHPGGEEAYLNAGEFFRCRAEREREPRIEALFQSGMGFAPDRNRRFQKPRAVLGEPDRATALIVLLTAISTSSRGLEAAQVSHRVD